MKPIYTKPGLPRYTTRSLPPYRYLPFQAGHPLPHPRNDPGGHSYDQEEGYLPDFVPNAWRDCEPYLYGIDLFNQGYWWEAHDALETVWLAAGQRATPCGRFIQGLIQLAGAQLKRFCGDQRGAESLTRAGCAKLDGFEEGYLGIAVKELIDEANRCLREDRGEYPSIELHFRANPPEG